MKKVLLIIIFIITGSILQAQQETARLQPKDQWGKQEREQFLSNREDSTKWDREMMMIDEQMTMLGYCGPFTLGAFPTPEYDLIGEKSFNGVGSQGAYKKLGEKNLVMNSFFVGKSSINEAFIKEEEDEIFFHIIILTDTMNASADDLDNSVILSRNHPDYLGQGYVKTKSTNIEYSAFITAERNAYAIVNTRLFDLNYGKTILIALQEDNTLRSIQIDSPDLSSANIKDYTRKLLIQEEVVNFFK